MTAGIHVWPGPDAHVVVAVAYLIAALWAWQRCAPLLAGFALIGCLYRVTATLMPGTRASLVTSLAVAACFWWLIVSGASRSGRHRYRRRRKTRESSHGP